MTEDIQTNELTETIRPCLILSYKIQGSDILFLDTKKCVHTSTQAHTYTHTDILLEVQIVDRPTGHICSNRARTKRAGGKQPYTPAKKSQRTIRLFYTRDILLFLSYLKSFIF